MLIGNPKFIAIESHIAIAYPELYQRALGYFLIYIDGKRYGVEKSEASLLACSFDAVRQRILQRGKHVSFICSEVDSNKIANSLYEAMYSMECEKNEFFGMNREKFIEHIYSNNLIWAPDGDEAFDDGSHVMQFDLDNKVRLLAFKLTDDPIFPISTVSDITVDADEFYSTLDTWQSRFESEWIDMGVRH